MLVVASAVVASLTIVWAGDTASAQVAPPLTPKLIAGAPGEGPGTSVAQGPTDVVVDGSQLLVVDPVYGVVREVDPTSGVHRLRHRLGHGSAARWRLMRDLEVQHIAVAPNGDLFVSDRARRQVLRVDRAGTVTPFAGKPTASPPDFTTPPPDFAGASLPAAEVVLHEPGGIAVDEAGDVLITDSGANRIYRVTPVGTMTVLAGTGQRGFAGDDGPATAATLAEPHDVVSDQNGYVWIADTWNDRLRVVDRSGTIRTQAGGAPMVGGPDVVCPPGQVASERCFHGPTALGLDPAGGVLVGGNGFVFRIGPDLRVMNVGKAHAVDLTGGPGGVVFVAAGTREGLLRMLPGGTVTRLGGVVTHVHEPRYRTSTGEGTPARFAQVGGTSGLAVDGDGRVRIAHKFDNVVMTVDPDGLMALSSGVGERASTLAVAADGTVLAGDELSGVIVRVRPGGGFDPVYGAQQQCEPDKGDGRHAATASIDGILDMAYGPDGSLYVLETWRVLRRISPAGIISTVVGTQGRPCGQGSFPTPTSPLTGDSVAVDRDGVVWVNGSCLQKLEPSGDAPCVVDNTAPAAPIPPPPGPGPSDLPPIVVGRGIPDVVIDGDGKVVFTDPEGHRVRRLEPDGTASLVAGGAGGCGRPDSLDMPSHLAVAPSGGIVVSDVSCDTVMGLGFSEPAVNLERLAGLDRLATAGYVSRARYGDGAATVVVLARADGFADALAGAPLATAKGGPLLLTSSALLDPWAESELRRVLPRGGQVHLLGGLAALSSAVEARVRELGYLVQRHAGSDRFDTAARIADGPLGRPTKVFLTNGQDFPDAVSAAAAAGAIGAAILLTDGERMPLATSAYLARGGAEVVAVGGPAARAGGASSSVVGADRYDTSSLLADRFFPAPSSVGLATGTAFPDALSGGAAMGTARGPLLLVAPGALPAPTGRYLGRVRASLRSVTVFGGTRAVAPAIGTAALAP